MWPQRCAIWYFRGPRRSYIAGREDCRGHQRGWLWLGRRWMVFSSGGYLVFYGSAEQTAQELDRKLWRVIEQFVVRQQVKRGGLGCKSLKLRLLELWQQSVPEHCKTSGLCPQLMEETSAWSECRLVERVQTGLGGNVTGSQTACKLAGQGAGGRTGGACSWSWPGYHHLSYQEGGC